MASGRRITTRLSQIERIRDSINTTRPAGKVDPC